MVSLYRTLGRPLQRVHAKGVEIWWVCRLFLFHFALFVSVGHLRGVRSRWDFLRIPLIKLDLGKGGYEKEKNERLGYE